MKTLNFRCLYPGQYTTLKRLEERKSAVVFSTRTGGGKNQVPLLYSLSHPLELVVVILPTRALIQSLFDTWEPHFKKGKLQMLMSSDDPLNYQSTTINWPINMRMLLLTPNQLMRYDIRGKLKIRNVGLLMIDECHNIAYAGLVYRAEYGVKLLNKYIKEIAPDKLLLTSATIDRPAKKEIKKLDRSFTLIRDSLARPNLKLSVFRCSGRGTKMILLSSLIKELHKAGAQKGIVYFSSVQNLLHVKNVFEELKLEPLVYFGKEVEEIPKTVKTANMREFQKGKKGLMFATCSFGEGMDISDVAFVINFDLPGSVAELYQWIGRAGRDGRQALVYQFVDSHSQKIREVFIESSKDDIAYAFQEKQFGKLIRLLNEIPQPTVNNLISDITYPTIKKKILVLKRRRFQD